MNGQNNRVINERERAALRAMNIFRGLSEIEFTAVMERSMIRCARYAKGAVIAGADSKIDDFMGLLSGRVIGVRERENGAQDFVQLYVAGEICGLDIVCSYTRKCPFRLQTLEESEIVFFDYNQMFSGRITGIEMRNLHEGVTRALANESLKRLHKIDVLYRKALRDRIVCYLRNLSAMIGSEYLEVNMNREQFAQYLGVNRSALSHELSLMKKDGLIDFSKSKFEILKEL